MILFVGKYNMPTFNFPAHLDSIKHYHNYDIHINEPTNSISILIS